jgi:hypothetical protein
MSRPQSPPPLISEQDDLIGEVASSVRHEFLASPIDAMADTPAGRAKFSALAKRRVSKGLTGRRDDRHPSKSNLKNGVPEALMA